MSSQQAARVSSQSPGTWDRSSASSMPKSEGKGFGAATAQYSRSWTQWFPTRHSRTGSCAVNSSTSASTKSWDCKNSPPSTFTGFLSGGSYEAIPLEMNAHELDDRCAAETTKAFSVADEVQRWIDTAGSS